MRNAILKTERLNKEFTPGKQVLQVLKDINIELYEGDFTVIMGSSGSGKSTLLYSLSSMDAPTNGRIEILGRNIPGLNEKQLSQIRRKDISFIFQSINLIPDLTSFENIAYPAYLSMSKKRANEKTEQLLRQFGLWEQRDKYPHEMSGGQQQRIAIIRAIAAEPRILFADEPTGALNSSSGTQVFDQLTGLNEKGQTIVMVTHDIKACARGSRLLYLTDGRIDGDLDLGFYRPEEQTLREERIFQFLKARHW